MEAVYEENYFEPYCRWKRGKDSDAIVIELDGFRFEDVKAALKQFEQDKYVICINAASPRRLQKNIEIPNDYYDLGNIRAVFQDGNLNLELPRKVNKLEVSMPKLEFTKTLQELTKDTKNKISCAVEYSYSKRNIAAFGFMVMAMLMASGLVAYRYYAECYGV